MTALLSDIDLLRRLVAFDSTSSNSNLPIADFIADYLDGIGAEILRIGPRPPQAPDNLQHLAEPPKTNLVVWVGPPQVDDERSGLVLSGHMDVVPALEEGWKSDPFTLAADETSLYGRGTSDMKGFLAVAMNAVRRLDQSHLLHPLVLILTYDEEVGTLGARQLVEEWPRERLLPKAGIIGEPTSLRLVRMHKGHLKLRLVVKGKSAHSGYPHLGRNAIELAGRMISALVALRGELEQEGGATGRFFPEVPFVPLNLGTIKGGAAVNIVPDRCEMSMGIRLLPGMETAAMVERVRKAVSAVAESSEWELEVISNSPPMMVDAESSSLGKLQRLLRVDHAGSVSFATDAGWLQSLGIDCLLYGPGSIELAHRPNELIPKSELQTAATLLPEIIAGFCGPPS